MNEERLRRATGWFDASLAPVEYRDNPHPYSPKV